MAISIFSSMEPVLLAGASQAPSLSTIFSRVLDNLAKSATNAFSFGSPSSNNNSSSGSNTNYYGNYADNVLTSVSTTATNQTNAFQWVQAAPDPDIIATADSVLIGFGGPIYSQNSVGASYPAVGFCSNFTFGTSNSVTARKELRAEHTIIIPGKANPGTISLSRLLTSSPNLGGVLAGSNTWQMDNQMPNYKKLFGLLIVFMSPTRRKDNPILGAAYAERCAFTGMSVGINAGQYGLFETVQIAFGRLLMPSTNSTTSGYNYYSPADSTTRSSISASESSLPPKPNNLNDMYAGGWLV